MSYAQQRQVAQYKRTKLMKIMYMRLHKKMFRFFNDHIFIFAYFIRWTASTGNATVVQEHANSELWETEGDFFLNKIHWTNIMCVFLNYWSAKSKSTSTDSQENDESVETNRCRLIAWRGCYGCGRFAMMKRNPWHSVLSCELRIKLIIETWLKPRA